MVELAVSSNPTAESLTAYQDLILEYVALSSSKSLSDVQAERVDEILTQAQEEPALCFWLDEVDYVLASKLELITESFVQQQQETLERVITKLGFETRRVDDSNNQHESVSIELSASELEVLNELSKKKEMSQSAIIRQALRVLGFIEERLNQGETFFFEGPGKEKEKVFL